MLKSKKTRPLSNIVFEVTRYLVQNQPGIKKNGAAVLPDIKKYSRCDQIFIMVGRDSYRY